MNLASAGLCACRKSALLPPRKWNSYAVGDLISFFLLSILEMLLFEQEFLVKATATTRTHCNRQVSESSESSLKQKLGEVSFREYH